MRKELIRACEPTEAKQKLKGIFNDNPCMAEKIDKLKPADSVALLVLCSGKTIVDRGNTLKSDYIKHRAAIPVQNLRDVGIPVETVRPDKSSTQSLYRISEETISKLVEDPERVTADYLEERNRLAREKDRRALMRIQRRNSFSGK